MAFLGYKMLDGQWYETGREEDIAFDSDQERDMDSCSWSLGSRPEGHTVCLQGWVRARLLKS